MATATGTFTMIMTPGPREAAGALTRFDLTKTWSGQLAANGIGVMLTAGDPQTGEAGYVLLETVDGTLDGRTGGFAFQQYATMHRGEQRLTYEIAPGSGHGELAGISGALELTVDDDGTHHYRLDYEL
jgi:hypothetical protein